MPAPAIVLLHSPLVGPGSWTKVAAQLCDRGFDAVVPRLAGVFDAPAPYYPKLVHQAVGAARIATDSEAIVLVGHSGAGALLPAIAQEMPAAVGAIFVDALLPHPGRSWFETVPPALRTHLLSLARDGSLPRWHAWWREGAIAGLLADDALYESFASGLHEIPLAYCEEPAPAAEMPDWVRCAYLQLSAACRADAESAAAKSWPVLRRNAHHLAMLTDPGDLASDLIMLCATIGMTGQ